MSWRRYCRVPLVFIGYVARMLLSVTLKCGMYHKFCQEVPPCSATWKQLYLPTDVYLERRTHRFLPDIQENAMLTSKDGV
ncbi:hypothetical protein GGR57DRAFT_289942 [Xylariaceae sp. FL1272]|nr:hypothetical protein GGR57DRAFT_289942 [Xylariaceae sp. FL1272]